MLLGLMKQKLEPEAYFAYLNRLPNNIRVAWKKLDGLFVGRIQIDGCSFSVQSGNPNEFVLDINEAVLLAFDTPREYLDILLKYPKFVPSREEWNLLRSGKFKESRMRFFQDKEVDKRVLA